MLLEDGLTIGGRSLRDVLEAVGHAKAYEFMFTLLKSRRIDEEVVLYMHRLFYWNIEPDYAGRYRDIQVIITGSHYSTTPPDRLDKEMSKVDGRTIAVMTSDEEMRTVLSSMKKKAVKDFIDAKAQFVEKVEILEGMHMRSELTDKEGLQSILSEKSEITTTHTIKNKETRASIAKYYWH